MNPNVLPSEKVAVVATIDPDANTAAAYTSDWFAAKDFKQFMAIVMAGALGSSATLDAKIQQATDASGTSAKDVTGKAITQMTEAGTDSDKQAIINFYAADIDTANSFTHFALVMTVGTATSDCAGIVLGMAEHYSPASDHDLASVDEIVE